jgi:hypothetical protein
LAAISLPVIDVARQFHRQGAAAGLHQFAFAVRQMLSGEGYRVGAERAAVVVERLTAAQGQRGR